MAINVICVSMGYAEEGSVARVIFTGADEHLTEEDALNSLSQDLLKM